MSVHAGQGNLTRVVGNSTRMRLAESLVEFLPRGWDFPLLHGLAHDVLFFSHLFLPSPAAIVMVMWDRSFSHGQTLRKHAYSNILKTLQPKKEIFQIKNSDIFHISAQNIDCGYSLEPPRRGGSNEYHNLCFCAEIRKIMYTPVNPSFTI